MFRSLLLRLSITCFVFCSILYSISTEEIIKQEMLKLRTTKEGEAFYVKQNLVKAKKKFLLSIEQHPKLGLPFFYLGMICDYDKLYEDSAMYLEKSLEFPLSKEFIKVALWKLIYYYYNRKNYHMTIYHIEKIYKIGIVSSKLNKIEKEIRPLLYSSKKWVFTKFQNYLIEYKKFQIKQQQAKNNELSISLGEFYQISQKKLRDLSNLLSEIISSDISYAGYVFEIALVFEDAHFYEDAIELYQETFNKAEDSQNPKIIAILHRIQYKLGFLYKRQSDFRSSVFYLKSLVNLEESNGDLLKFAKINLAQSLYAQYDYDGALDSITNVVFKDDEPLVDVKQLTGDLLCLIYSKKILNTYKENVISHVGKIKETPHFLFCTDRYKNKKISDFLNEEVSPKLVLRRYTFFYWNLLKKRLGDTFVSSSSMLLLPVYTSMKKISSYNEKKLLKYQEYYESTREKIAWLFTHIYNDLLWIYKEMEYKNYYVITKILKPTSSFTLSEQQQNQIDYLFAYTAFVLKAYDEAILLYRDLKKNWSDETRLWLSLVYKNNIKLLRDYVYTYLKYHSSSNEIQKVITFLKNRYVFSTFYKKLAQEELFQKFLLNNVSNQKKDDKLIDSSSLNGSEIIDELKNISIKQIYEYQNVSIPQNKSISVEQNISTNLQN